MSYLVKTPLFSYLIEYFNDSFGFRESKISSMNKSAARELEAYVETETETPIVQELKSKGHNLKDLVVRGSFDKVEPLHVQIELTDNCNLLCDYCYRNAKFNNPNSGYNFGYIDLERIKRFLLKQKKGNLLEVGVTGGEPTLNPHFKEIMGLVLENFELSELVTNGTNYQGVLDMLDYVGENSKKLNLSVSFNRWFRDFDQFETGDHYLNKFLDEVADKHPIRMIFTDIEYDLEKAERAKNMFYDKGVKDVDFSFVSPIGRARKKINELEHLKRFKHGKKNEDRFTPTPLNCGLTFKHTAIDPKGNLRPCALFPLDFQIGTIDSFIDDKGALWTMPAPRKEICGSCDYADYCRGCIYKGLFNSNEDCNYRRVLSKNRELKKFLPHID